MIILVGVLSVSVGLLDQLSKDCEGYGYLIDTKDPRYG